MAAELSAILSHDLGLAIPTVRLLGDRTVQDVLVAVAEEQDRAGSHP
jgi:hypothetical protein